jgi:two-component system, sensor histidine kinase and response regulator
MTGPQAQKHIVVIEDTPHVLALLTEILEEAGYRVTPEPFSTTPSELFHHLKEEPPDLIVLDLMLGHTMGGWNLLCWLKRDSETRGLPVVLCSAASGLVREEQPLLDQLDVGVVLKPFDIDDLLGEVTRALAASESLKDGPENREGYNDSGASPLTAALPEPQAVR